MTLPHIYLAAERVTFLPLCLRHPGNDAFDTLLIQAVRVRSNDNPGPEAA